MFHCDRHQQEGKKFWMSVLMNLRIGNEGCVYHLHGWTEKNSRMQSKPVLPSTLMQTCIVHLIRASLNFVNWKERKAIAADLKTIYRAARAEVAELVLKRVPD